MQVVQSLATVAYVGHTEERNSDTVLILPMWKKGVKQTLDTCTYKCQYPENTKVITPSEEYQLSFSKALKTQDTVIALCNKHYQLLYRKVHMHGVCAGCGSKPRARQSAYYRHSPDAATVCQYLNANTEFSVCITQDNTVCRSCYDLHLAILQNVEREQTPQQNLQSDIMLWSMTLENDSISEVTQAVLATVIYIAKLLQQDRAILLPQAATVFHMNYPGGEENGCLHLDVSDGTIMFTGKWLLNQLIIHLQPYMDYRCVAPRLGTLLYPRKGDLLKCLTHALYQCPPYGDMLLKNKSKHICADASVWIAYASLHAGNLLQSKSYDLMLMP